MSQVSIDQATGCPGPAAVTLGTSLAVYGDGDPIELTLDGQWDCRNPARYIEGGTRTS